ncbi:hypothetical protein [Microbacterium nymphoidis]|uniref:hypothetical protein n=1 Tax=Microbacterium nymphoidis TaxID=2898586 RepID=UPI001E574B4F|nr:hypothetical protein [Microbacterium nymphoidis]MCD2498502.1 hypothetical protein [Microbacterium nymphoidis]
MTELVGEHLLNEALGLGAETPYSPNEIRIAVRPFLHWCIDVAALDAELTPLLDPRVIERFIQEGIRGYTGASAGNIRSRLLRLSEAASRRSQGRVFRSRALPPARPLRPYSDIEIASLRSWAGAQSTAERQRNAAVLLALGLGVGLSAAEIAETRARHVQIIDGVCIAVPGERARVVWAQNEWSGVLVEAMEPLQPDDYLFRSRRTSSWPNVITNFVGSSTQELRPQTQRMRATWIVTHLKAGTKVSILLRAAGVDSLEAFTRYTVFLPEPTPEEAREALLLEGHEWIVR